MAIEINKQMYRAVIQNISVDMFGEENTEQVTNQYLCWLIDCGTMVEAKKMYKLPISLKKTPPLAVQVCLNGIGYVHEVIPILYSLKTISKLKLLKTYFYNKKKLSKRNIV